MAMTAEQWRNDLLSRSTGAGMNGLIYNMNNSLKDLKAQVQAGKLSLSDYQQVIEGNTDWISRDVIGRELSAGSKAAQGAKDAGAEGLLRDFFSYDPTSSGYKAKLPFTKSEYAQLPDNVLPTREDAQKGLFDPYQAPLDRYRGDTAAGTGPGQGGLPSGGVEGGPTDQGRDEKKLLEEAEFAKGKRQDWLGEMGDLLYAQQNRAFNDSAPDIMEDLNSRGLLRSSALGDRFAKEKARLAAGTSEQLAMTGGAINEAYLGDRGSAIGRRFSIEDFARQLDAAKNLGSQSLPQVAGSGGGKGAGALSGAASGAATGANFGPWGAGIGGVVGGVTGGQLGSK